MTLPPWVRSVYGALAALAVLALGLFAVQRVKGAVKAGRKADARAEHLETNTEVVERAAEKAVVKRAEAAAHVAKAAAIKVKAEEQLHELEATRGSSTARALADRLGRL